MRAVAALSSRVDLHQYLPAGVDVSQWYAVERAKRREVRKALQRETKTVTIRTQVSLELVSDEANKTNKVIALNVAQPSGDFWLRQLV